MNIKDFTALIKSSKDRMRSEHAKIAMLSALDASALMKSRVINERVDAGGDTFGLYSKRYQKSRISANLLGTAVNFSFTNKMWNSTRPRFVSDDGLRVEILISPSRLNVFKMVYNTERFGPILELSPDEIKIHADIYETRLKTI